ncbi:hexose transporter hxt5 [Savitreella phatthalungensis]
MVDRKGSVAGTEATAGGMRSDSPSDRSDNSISRNKTGVSDYGRLAREQAGISDDDPRVSEKEKITAFSIFIAVVAAMGGTVFGYDTGQISGFLEMPDFLQRFGERQLDGSYAIPVWREGAIVALLSVGTLFGALSAGPIADTRLARKGAFFVGNIIFIIGIVVQLCTFNAWEQMMMGRFIAGLGVGQLSVITPLYIGETAPKRIRGTLVSSYQFFITLGILIAYGINAGTHTIDGQASWKITIGLSIVWPLIMMAGLLICPESPRFLLSRGQDEKAVLAMEKIRGVFRYNVNLASDLDDMRALINIQSQEKHGWSELYHGEPRVFNRLVLGFVLQASQQLSGINYFLYYSVSIFSGVGLDNSFVTSVILGVVNSGCTPLGLFAMEYFGRRKPLIIGSCWMAMCFLVYAVVGLTVTDPAGPSFPNAKPTHTGGVVLIVFTCLYILGFSTTWSCGTWAVNAEIHKSSVRAKAIAITTAGNWSANFLLAFFTSPIASKISYAYGFVFMFCNIAGALIVWFFVYETSNLSLEQIDELYADRSVTPWRSPGWTPPAKIGRDAYTEREPKIRGEVGADATNTYGAHHVDNV